MTNGKIMNDYYANWYISQCHRAEWDENPHSYMKAIRVSLINLGYDPEWVNGKFRVLMEKWYYEQ